MNRTIKPRRLDGLMLAMGLSIALASTYAKADPSADATATQVLKLAQPAEQSAKWVSVPLGGSPDVRSSYSVQLQSDGGSTRVLFVPAATTTGVTAGMKANAITKPTQAELFF